MRAYSCVWNATNTQSVTVPIMTLTTIANVRPKLAHFIMGTDAAPADNDGTFIIQRHSTNPAGGTAGTPAPIDPDTGAALSSYMYGASIGAPTLGTKLFQ